MQNNLLRKGLVFGIIILMVGVGFVQNIITTIKADPTDGLMGYWSFNEGSGDIVYDSSGNNNDAMIYGASWSAGISGYGLAFDGQDDYVEVPPINEIVNISLNEITFQCWVYLGESTESPQQIIEGRTLVHEILLERSAGTSIILFDIMDDYGVLHHITTSELLQNYWYNIVGVVDGSSQFIYVNGELNNASSWAAPFTITTGFTMGKDYEEDMQYLNGKLDEFRIYNRALTEDEIQGLYTPLIVYVDDDFNSSTPGWGYDHFSSIQAGIDAVDVGGTIFVYSGVYYENVVIAHDNIHLVGENKRTTIIDANGIGNALYIAYHNNNQISNFTIRNAGEQGVYIFASSSTHSWLSQNNTLKNCIITGNSGNGVYVHPTGYGCRIHDTKILNCVISENGGNGIYLHAEGNHCSIGYSSNITFILDCMIQNNSGDGMRMFAEDHHSFISCTRVMNNIISGNNGYGINVMLTPDCWNDNHLIYHNNFIDNGQNALDALDPSVSMNKWYNETFLEGNYWSDYASEDNNDDGIGDTPYNIPGGSNQDLYPLMTPYGHPHADFTTITENNIVTFNASFSYDYDGIITDYLWQFGDGTNGTGVLVNHLYPDYGTYAVSLTVTDDDEDNDTIIKYVSLDDLIPPIISDITLLASEPLDTDPSFGWINTSCDVTDDLHVSDVRLNITCPDGSTTNISMNALELQNYYYNTTFTQYGNYHYFIWASDTYGNTCTSSNYEFMMPPNWDINIDGEDNLLDLILQSNHYGETGSSGWLREDVNNNGIINVLDLAFVSNYYDQQWLEENDSNSDCFGDPSIISVYPPNQTVSCGENFTVGVYFASGQPIKGWELRLAYNASLITVHSVSEGDFFDGFTTFFNPGIFNNTLGNIVKVYDFIVGPGIVSDPGTFITISFTAGSIAGTSFLTLYHVGVGNETSYVPITVCNGYVEVAQNNPPYVPSSPSPANGSTGVSINIDLGWIGGDPDPGDTVTFDVYFGTSSSPTKIVSNITGTTYGPYMDYSTLYYWRIVAWDNHGASAVGPLWHFMTDNPPYVPSSPGPANDSTDVSINVDLSWIGGDPDPGDTVLYDVYFGMSSNPPKVASNISSYDPGTLMYDTLYYWRIVAWDNHNASSSGPIWHFTTESEMPPYPPSNPSPPDGATNVPVDGVILSWTGGDPDGDPVTYDVYFGATNPIPTIIWNQTETSCYIEDLLYSTQYFWRVVAWDEHGENTIGPVWTFTTEEEPNDPPNAPLINGPTSGNTGEVYTYTFVAVDPDADNIYYEINWGDGQIDDWFGPCTSNLVITRTHQWSEKGTYVIQARAKDVHDATGEWGSLSVTMPMDLMSGCQSSQQSISFQLKKMMS